jgi:uncharacterized protein
VQPDIQRILAELRGRLELVYGDRLAQLVLFGSRARGDAQEDSDIDVLVVLRGAVRAGEEISRAGDITADISLENDVVISCVFVSGDRWARERSPLLMNVRREGVPA